MLPCFWVDQRGGCLSAGNRAENLEDVRKATSCVEVCRVHTGLVCQHGVTAQKHQQAGLLVLAVGKGSLRALVRSVQTWPKQGTALGNYAHDAAWKAGLGQQRTCREG